MALRLVDPDSERAAALKQSTRQQRAFKAVAASEEVAGTTFDAVMAALDKNHIGRVEASPAGARTWTESEWALEQERRAREREVNPNAFAFYGPGV